jgi:hypothetical protein
MPRQLRPHERDCSEPERRDDGRRASRVEDEWLELIADIILRDLFNQDDADAVRDLRAV